MAALPKNLKLLRARHGRPVYFVHLFEHLFLLHLAQFKLLVLELHLLELRLDLRRHVLEQVTALLIYSLLDFYLLC